MAWKETAWIETLLWIRDSPYTLIKIRNCLLVYGAPNWDSGGLLTNSACHRKRCNYEKMSNASYIRGYKYILE